MLKQLIIKVSLVLIVLVGTVFSFSAIAGDEIVLSGTQLGEKDLLKMGGFLLLGFFMILAFIFIFGFFKKDKLEIERFAFSHSILTSRMILGFGSIAYPFLNYINYISEEKVYYPEIEFPIIVGVVMVFMVLLSFKSDVVKRVLPKTIVVFFALVLAHVSFITLVNLLLPLHVIGLCLVLSLASIVIADPVKLLISGVFYLALIIGLSNFLPSTEVPQVQLISALFTALTIAFLLSITKKSLNSRLSAGSKILNDLHSLILITDRGGNIQYVNQGTKRLLGQRRRDLLGFGWWKLSSHQLTSEEAIFEQVSQYYDLAERTIISKETDSEGKDVFVRWRFQKLENDWLALIGENITENFLIEQELEKLSIVAKYADVGIIISDKDSKVEWVNAKYEEMSGYALADFLGKHPADVVAGEGTDLSVVHATRETEAIVSGQKFEVLNYTKTGDQRWISVVSSPILNEAGEIVQIIEIAQDITLQKEQDARLKFEADMNALINKIDIILMKSPQWNASMTAVLETLERQFPETNHCGFYEFSGDHVLFHGSGDEGLPRLNAKDSAAIMGIKNHMLGPKLIYNQSEGEKWSEAVQDALGVTRKSNFIFYGIKEKGHLLGYFAVSSEDQHFIRPEIIKVFGTFVEHINLKLVQFLDSERISSLNKKLHHINEMNTAVLNGQNVGQKIENLLKDLLGDSLIRANVLLLDLENEKAKYYYKMEDRRSTYDDVFPISRISETALNNLKRDRYFAVEDLRKRENPSESDLKMLEDGVISFMMFPLFQGGKLYASLNISMNKTLSSLDQGLDNFFNDLTKELSISIYQKVLLEQTESDKNEIENLHKDIKASVRSAERIQASILPSLVSFDSYFEDSMVLFKPRDIVSGDFYFLEEHNGKLFVAVADSTGHGVPGALVSMVCKNVLNKCILERNMVDPSNILEKSRELITAQFGTVDDVMDGMDIALCVLDLQTQLCDYAGAHNPLWILKNGEKKLVEIKGDRIGVSPAYPTGSFTKHTVPYEEGDQFFLFSDGFSDQFGGPRFRKFGPQRMREMIKKTFYLSHAEKKASFLSELKAWQQDHDQIDDICLMSFTPKVLS